MTETDLADRVEELADVVADVQEENERLREENEALRERVDELERHQDETANVRWDSSDGEEIAVESTDGSHYPLGRVLAGKASEYELESELEDLRERLAEGDLAPDQADAPTPTGPTVTPETPLEDVVDLPEHVAESELSPNQQRARFVAGDVRSYTTKVPAGFVLEAGDMARVLAAGTDTEPHSETVRRVMRVLENLGKDHVDVVKRRGTKRVVFDEEIVDRLARITDEAHTVVRPDEGEECEATA
jgi:regulator of replication initiation timing